eukprot:SM000121S26000  [mRNA]  locus=s121:195393:196448:- [translate_table: standard]
MALDPTLPGFWRDVAAKVDGRTAKECFDKVTAESPEFKRTHSLAWRTVLESSRQGGNNGSLAEAAAAASVENEFLSPLSSQPPQQAAAVPVSRAVQQLLQARQQAQAAETFSTFHFDALHVTQLASVASPSVRSPPRQTARKSGGGRGSNFQLAAQQHVTQLASVASPLVRSPPRQTARKSVGGRGSDFQLAAQQRRPVAVGRLRERRGGALQALEAAAAAILEDAEAGSGVALMDD